MLHPIKHFLTITNHRHKVMMYCFKSGLIIQGLMHDLSKYGFTEFWLGAKYYDGKKSPHYNERIKNGYSRAWLHHKGRNKHHIDYWMDVNMKTFFIEPVEMPNKYIMECVCDRIAASKVYNKGNFKPSMVLDYFNKEAEFLPMHEKTKEKIVFLLNYYIDNGEKKLFKYMKKNFRKNKN